MPEFSKYLFISIRIVEIVVVALIGILHICIPSVPNFVYILQGQNEFEKTLLPVLIAAFVIVGSTILTMCFQIFVYFGLTQQSKNMISFRSLTLLLMQFIFPFIFIVFKLDFQYLIYSIYAVSFIRYMLIPLEILYSNTEARYHLKINHHKLLNFPHEFMNCNRSFMNVCCYVVDISNEVAPIEFRVAQRLRNVNIV